MDGRHVTVLSGYWEQISFGAEVFRNCAKVLRTETSVLMKNQKRMHAPRMVQLTTIASLDSHRAIQFVLTSLFFSNQSFKEGVPALGDDKLFPYYL